MDRMYRENDPRTTVNNIKNIFLKWGISVTEEWYEKNQMDSLALNICGTDFYSYGRGNGKMHALASAYGEMLERLGNHVFFRIKGDCAHRLPIGKNYYSSYLEFSGDVERWTELLEIADGNDLIDNLWTYGKLLGPEVKYCTFTRGNEELRLPLILLDLFYGTNGMSAGNTKLEAQNQALCELLERYVIKKILMYKEPMVDITQDVCSNFPEVKRWINELESGEMYSIEIKDASYGENIPAVAVVLYNKSQKGYYVKIDVHPSLYVAVERCFSELLQGRNISDIEYFTFVGEDVSDECEEGNFSNILVYGDGVYPVQICGNSKKYTKYRWREYENSQDINDELLKILEMLDKKVYTNFSTRGDDGLITCQVIVPRLSEVWLHIDACSTVEKAIEHERISQIIERGLVNASEQELDMLSEFVEKNELSDDIPLGNFVNFPRMDEEHPINNILVSLFKGMYYLRKQKNEKSIFYLKKYISYFGEETDMSYYQCLISFLLLKNKGMGSVTQDVLRKLYSDELIQEVENTLNQNPFDGLTKLCKNTICDKCENCQNCFSTKEMAVYKKLLNNGGTLS